jgi:hypothetical protein
MAHKVKPQLLFLKESNNEIKQQLIERKALNLHKYRYLFFELDFDYKLFKEHQQVKEGKNNVIVKYTGVDYAELLF